MEDFSDKTAVVSTQQKEANIINTCCNSPKQLEIEFMCVWEEKSSVCSHTRLLGNFKEEDYSSAHHTVLASLQKLSSWILLAHQSNPTKSIWSSMGTRFMHPSMCVQNTLRTPLIFQGVRGIAWSAKFLKIHSHSSAMKQ